MEGNERRIKCDIICPYFSYDLRTKNIFRRMGMPGPAPIPVLGEMLNLIRKVDSTAARALNSAQMSVVHI